MNLATIHSHPKSQLTAYYHIPQAQLRVIEVACDYEWIPMKLVECRLWL